MHRVAAWRHRVAAWVHEGAAVAGGARDQSDEVARDVGNPTPATKLALTLRLSARDEADEVTRDARYARGAWLQAERERA